MALPGPGGVGWGLELLLFAAATLPTGELLRRLSARYVRLFRGSSPLEVALLDLYLTGGFLFGIGAIPAGLFSPQMPEILLLGGGAGLLAHVWLERHHSPWVRIPPPIAWDRLRTIPFLVAIAAAASLYAVEIAVSEGVPTGNTFDSSILAMFLGLTHLHQTLPQSFAPIAPQATAYPQALTAWMYSVQSFVSLPPSRAALLVTPLFLSLGPLAAYVWAERWWRNAIAAGVFALGFALLLAWTRVLVAGSNDFAAAFPLVLLLWAWLPTWTADRAPGLADSIAFGGLAGISAAFNPVGAQLLFVALPGFAISFHSALRRRPLVWIGRWAIALTSAMPFVVPSLSVLWQGRTSPGLVTGGIAAAGGGLAGLSPAQIVGLVDPFLFRSTDVWFSPFPVVRAELALLLVLGLGLLFVPGLRRATPGEDLLRAFLPAFFLAAGLIFLGEWAASVGVPGARVLADITSGAEASILLFTVYGAVCLLPVVRAAEAARPSAGALDRTRALASPNGSPPTPRRSGGTERGSPALIALGLATLVFIPGVVATTAELPGYLHQLYFAFGNTSMADFDLLHWADANLPAGARVLVAPGSSAQFLPGTRPDLALLSPVAPIANNASYQVLVRELDQGVLTPASQSAIGVLHVEYILVTQANTDLWLPFSPVPLLAAPTQFLLEFHEGDAYAFAVAGAVGS